MGCPPIYNINLKRIDETNFTKSYTNLTVDELRSAPILLGVLDEFLDNASYEENKTQWYYFEVEFTEWNESKSFLDKIRYAKRPDPVYFDHYSPYYISYRDELVHIIFGEIVC